MSSSSSDEETPVSISFKKAKKEHESEVSEIGDFLKRRQALKKVRRRAKTEFLRNQKVMKRQKEEEQKSVNPRKKKSTDRKLPQDIVDSLIEQPNIEEEDQVTFPEIVSSLENLESEQIINKKIPMSKKTYGKLNIKVESLPQIENKRAASAYDFKSKRLSKPHRESVHNMVIHHEKLIASGRMFTCE